MLDFQHFGCVDCRMLPVTGSIVMSGKHKVCFCHLSGRIVSVPYNIVAVSKTHETSSKRPVLCREPSLRYKTSSERAALCRYRVYDAPHSSKHEAGRTAPKTGATTLPHHCQSAGKSTKLLFWSKTSKYMQNDSQHSVNTTVNTAKMLENPAFFCLGH